MQCSKTHAVDRPAKLHQNAFAFVVTGVALRTPWMQKSLKIIENLPLNKTHKIRMPVLQWSETHVVDRPANMHQNALIFVVPAVALLTPWMQNSFKIDENHRWQHVMCRRSCPPRGGPIRSVSITVLTFHRFYYMEK